MSLYEGAVKKPIMTSLCFLAVVIFGLFSLSKLPIDLYPDIDTNTIMVMTAYPGASASDIENNVTRPLENVLNSVSNLKHITSRSSENMSLITLEFEFGNDIDVLTNDVRDKLDMVSSELPDDVENPIIFKFSTDMIPIVLLSVQANESQAALYKILDDRVVNPLARIPGVGTVSISGAPQREIQVYCDPYKLEAYNLSIETISSIIGAENRNIPGGNFDIGSETYALRVEGEFDDSRQLADIVVDSCVPLVDASVPLKNHFDKVGPLSTLSFVTMVWMTITTVAEILADRGVHLYIHPSHNVPGDTTAHERLDAAIAEYQRKVKCL